MDGLQDSLGDGEGENGGERGELAWAGRRRLAEGPASRAGAQMRADAARLQHAAIAVGQASAHVVAAQLSALGHMGERQPGLVDELLHAPSALIEDARDLLVREPRELAQHQRPALVGRQLQEVLP